MSYELTGPIGFANQGAAAKAMRVLGHHLLTDGIMRGCELSYNGGMSCTVAPGYLILCGGEARNPSQQTILFAQSSGYARIIVNFDGSKAATTSEFKQVFFSVDYAASVGGFGALTQQDINGSGMLYQAEFAVIQIGTGVSRQIGGSETAAGLPRPKTLWSGTWSSGSITIPGIGDYGLIGVQLNAYSVFSVCDIRGLSAFSNGGSYYSVDNNACQYLFRIARSGDTLTLQKCIWYYTPESSSGNLQITKIVGLAKTNDIG